MPFQKGQINNPAGRPVMPAELKSKLKNISNEVVDFWINTLRDEGASWPNRNKSAENIIQYAYGKPKEIIDVDLAGKIEGITVEIVKKIDADEDSSIS